MAATGRESPADRFHGADVDNLQPAPQHTIVFTDDLSPIEWMTNNLILNFILHGDMNTLRIKNKK